LLADRIRPPVRVLLVGINPGIRSAAIGHHFAGASNRFWKLLFDSGLVREAIGPEDDGRLPEWGLGLTNLIPRCTPGIDTLRRQEYAAGERVLRRKVRRLKPPIVAFVGITLFRAVFDHDHSKVRRDRREDPSLPAQRSLRFRVKRRIRCGLQRERFEGARVFVLPNPSGRNANFSYAEMLAAFRALARVRVGNPRPPRRPRERAGGPSVLQHKGH
jgi:TDG/mug DNA glycosylase family protein